jgi:hypothetical protein
LRTQSAISLVGGRGSGVSVVLVSKVAAGALLLNLAREQLLSLVEDTHCLRSLPLVRSGALVLSRGIGGCLVLLGEQALGAGPRLVECSSLDVGGEVVLKPHII